MFDDLNEYLVLLGLLALVPVGIVLYLCVEVYSLRRRVKRLEGTAPASSPAPLQSSVPASDSTQRASFERSAEAAVESAPSHATERAFPVVEPAFPGGGPAFPGVETALPGVQGAFANVAAPAADAPALRKPAINWEVFAGGKMLNLIGGIVLVIGVGLLLKYAFDQNWVNATMRVLGGLVLGGGLVVAGDRMHSRARSSWFPQGLIGAGLGILYLSGYASFGSYHLVPFTLAYAFMSAVTVAAFLLALRYDSLGIALVGWAGGFATPFGFNDGPQNELGLASYLVLLDIGVAATALVKSRWFALTPLALLGSYFTVEGWYAQNGDPSQWFVSTIALASLWLVFFASGVAQALREPRASFDWKQLLGVLNVAFFWSCAAAVLDGHRGALETLTLVAAAAYFAAWAAVKARADFAKWQRAQYAITSAVLIALAASLHASGYALASIYALVALDVIVAETSAQVRGSRYAPAVEAPFAAAGFLTLAAAIVAGRLSSEGFDPSQALVKLRLDFFHSADLALAAIFIAGLALDRGFSAPTAAPSWLRAVARQTCVLAVLCLSALHLSGFDLVGAVAFEAVAFVYVGTHGMLRDLEIGGLVVFGLDLLHFAALPGTWAAEHVFRFVPILNERFAAFALVATALLGAGECYRRRSLLPAYVGRTVRALGVLAGVAGLSLDLADFFARLIALTRNEIPQSPDVLARLAQLTNGEQLAISGLWILSSLLLIALGVRLRVRDLRLMAIGLFDLTILKAFFVDLGSLDGLYRILSFIGLGLTLLLVSAIYQRLERGFFEPQPAGEAEAA
jgi:uncharacterized membrane protein